MLKNYFTIAFRNLFRQKVFSVINVLGLAIGLTVAILVFLDVHDEFTFDAFNKNAENIFRVVQVSKIGESQGFYSRISNVWTDKIKAGIPEIKKSTRYWAIDGAIKVGNELFKEKISFVDPAFMDMFTFPLIEGEENSILKDKSYIIITKETADRCFKHINPVGKTLTVEYENEEKDFLVGGVAENPPENSSIKFSVLVPFENCMNTMEMKISSGVEMEPAMSPAFFIELNNPAKASFVSSKITRLLKEFVINAKIPQTIFSLQPLTSIHLDSNYQSGLIPTGTIRNIYILILLALLTLFLVSANFVNLSVARSSHRFKEIGMRKIMGSDKKRLAAQFLTESILLTLFALLLAVVIAELLLPSFNNIIGKELKFDYVSNSSLIPALLFIALVTGITAGVYPAFYLSRLKPSSILKGEQKLGGSNLFTRVLVVAQFVISIFLIVCTIVISKQNSFIRNKNLGFNPGNILVLNGPNIRDDKLFERYKNEITNLSFVKSATISSDIPGKEPFIRNVFSYVNKSELANFFRVDLDYLKTFDLNVNEGRWFSQNYPGDFENGIVVNKAFVKSFGISNPVNKIVVYRMVRNIDKRIIGVIDDYNFLDLHEKTRPLVLMLNGGGNGMQFYMFIKLNSKINEKDMLTLKQIWNKVAGFRSFDPFYLSSFIEEQYLPEKRWNNIVGYLSIITILIACLGLFGLVNYSTEKRTKEIGIRKAMGASSFDILKLIFKEMIILISISFLIAAPLGFYFMRNWLGNFAYKINIGLDIFALAALIVIILTVFTVSYQTVRTALSNPVDSLRNE